MQQFFGHSVGNLIGRITKGKRVDGCSCIFNESALTTLLSCTEVNGSPGECRHGFKRKAFGGEGEERRRID